MKKINNIILILIILLLAMLVNGCSDDTAGKIDKEDLGDKVTGIILKEKLDYNKEILSYSGGMAEYAVSPPKDAKELYDSSKYVVVCKAVDTMLNIDKESGFTFTLVKFHVEDFIKGKIKSKDFTAAFRGGYISGEKYVEIHPDFKMGVLKGANENEEKNKYINKIVNLGGMAGEVIPRVGNKYLLFLDAHKLKLDGIEYYYPAGYEFAQGVFEINNDMVRDFNPDDREAAFYKAVENNLTDREILALMNSSTEEVDIKEFIDKCK